jgi:hypothetical protein
MHAQRSYAPSLSQPYVIERLPPLSVDARGQWVAAHVVKYRDVNEAGQPPPELREHAPPEARCCSTIALFPFNIDELYPSWPA